jgi:hypothetical protein
MMVDGPGVATAGAGGAYSCRGVRWIRVDGWRQLPVEVVGQRVEGAVPVAGQRGEELLGLLHRGGEQPVADSATLSRFGGDQAGVG